MLINYTEGGRGDHEMCSRARTRKKSRSLKVGKARTLIFQFLSRRLTVVSLFHYEASNSAGCELIKLRDSKEISYLLTVR